MWNPLLSRDRSLVAPTNRLVYSPGTSAGARTVWIFSYTGVSNEPRVLRQATAMLHAGWRVVVFGWEGHSPRPDEWHFVRLPAEAPYGRYSRYFLMSVRVAGMAIAKFGLVSRIRSLGARICQACTPRYHWFGRELERFWTERPDLKPDLVISHDYFTADVGYASARRFAARFIIDCHEYARGQYMHDPRWVSYVRPYVAALQDYYLARADAVTTVSEGIAELLNKEQKLKRPVQAIRSVPFRSVQSFRPTGDRITVLYHGGISYVRGLHKAVKSMPLWRPEFHLLLRGDADPAYADELLRIARECGVADRLTIEPPVAFDEIIPAANDADIGYFVHKDLSPQKRFVLPNKFFEYVMAGLALCVSDLPEMARHVQQYGCGKLVPQYDEESIASVINSFDRASIDEMKKKSLAAARELNWEIEQARMLSLYEEVLR